MPLPVAGPGETIDCPKCIRELGASIWLTNDLTRRGYVIGALPAPKPKAPREPDPRSAQARTLSLGDLLS